ncbi:MAG: hypothetical protein DMF69_09810 [Acidobacteria bacterium]|nr:MAG: hypothetical protein DMF69_09810 [Acidobacteriota bacterium]
MGCTTPGVPKDGDNNAADFRFVNTTGTLTAAGQLLGAPGPEGLTSPVRRDTTGIGLPLLDALLPAASAPNRLRTLTDPVYGSPFGTMTIRRRVTNNTGNPVTQLRFRIIEFTTFPAPAGIADLRARTGVDEGSISVSDPATCTASGAGSAPCIVTVLKTTLDQPPTQSIGGGLNSTMSVTLESPLPNGESVNVSFLLGVHQPGTFRFLVIVEALP